MTAFKVGDKVVNGGGALLDVVGVNGDWLWVTADDGGGPFSSKARYWTVAVPDVIEVREIVEAYGLTYTRKPNQYNSEVDKHVIGYLHINVTKGTAVVLDHA